MVCIGSLFTICMRDCAVIVCATVCFVGLFPFYPLWELPHASFTYLEQDGPCLSSTL